jgi:hypothetical protein
VWTAGGALGTTALAAFGAWSIWDLRKQRNQENLKSQPLLSIYRRWETTYTYFVMANTGEKTLLIHSIKARGGPEMSGTSPNAARARRGSPRARRASVRWCRTHPISSRS